MVFLAVCDEHIVMDTHVHECVFIKNNKEKPDEKAK
jgi:hypothetical protein